PEWGGFKVQSTDASALEIDLDVPAEGRYALHIGHVARTVGDASLKVNGVAQSAPIVVHDAGAPESTVYPNLQLPAGKAKLLIERTGGIGVYGIKLLPLLRPMAEVNWAVVGPFPSTWKESDRDESHLKEIFDRVLPPEQD